MSKLLLGTICGLIYGALSAASMIPLEFPDKRAALTGAFINRFAIGFVIGIADLPLPGWAKGLLIGLLLRGGCKIKGTQARESIRWRLDSYKGALYVRAATI